MAETVPVVLTPLDDHMGLDIARSLGKRGIPVYGLDSDRDIPGRYSKYVRFVQCPNADLDNGSAFVQFLIDFGKKLGKRTVLYPLSDQLVLLVSRERSVLEEYYEFAMPDNETLTNLTTKDGLQDIAEEYHIPAPRTFFINRDSDIESIAKNASYPVILKPTESTYWHNPKITALLRKGLLAARAKIILCQDAAELLKAYRLISALDNRLVVQEVIPGEDRCLVYFSFYLDRHSKPLGTFAGRKCRVIPIGFGSASYVRSMHDPLLEKAAFKLLDSVSYRGLGGIEFKLDPRDNQYKLIEFNTRFGMWDGLGVKCGVDLAYLAYCDALNIPVTPITTYRDGVIWIDWQRDTRAVIEYLRAGKMTPGDWLHSLRGEKMWAIYSMEDWRPGAAFTLSLVQRFWKRIFAA